MFGLVLFRYNNLSMSLLYKVTSLKGSLPSLLNFVEEFKGLAASFGASKLVSFNKSRLHFLCEVTISSFEFEVCCDECS